MTRPEFGTRFGVLMTFIGVAVGLGNVWRFPYMVGAFGGGAFLLIYVIMLAAFGIPALMAELTLGRMTRRGPFEVFARIGMPGGRVVGWVLMVTVFMAVTYYTVIVGWVLKYFLISITGAIEHIDPETFFSSVLDGFSGQFVMTAIVTVCAATVLGLGVRRGAERVSSVGIPILFLLLLVLIARSLTLPGAGQGLVYYLVPDLSKVTPGVLTAALGQVFFSMSLGGTFMLTYATYLPGTTDLARSAIGVGVGETLAAVLAGLVIVPAAVVFGLELNSGPPLTFVTVPNIFAQLPSGALFAACFFGLLFYAAFLSDVAAFEVLVTALVDAFGWSRMRSTVGVCGAALAVGTVSMLSLDYIVTSDLVWGSIMQPVGSALALIGLAWVVGLSRGLEEVNRGADRPVVGRFWFYWIKYVVPIGIAMILVFGMRDLFRTLLG